MHPFPGWPGDRGRGSGGGCRMIFTSLLETAWHARTTHRMRSFLTMLGMVIGVAAVILMLAIGQGAQAMVRSAIESLGSNLFIIMSGADSSGGARVAPGG